MTAQQWISIVSGRMRGLSVLFRSYRRDFLNRMRRDEMGEEEICDGIKRIEKLKTKLFVLSFDVTLRLEVTSQK